MKGRFTISVNQIMRILCGLYIMSLPMMPIFTRGVYYILGFTTFIFSGILYLKKKDKLSSLEIMEIIFTLVIAFSMIYTISADYTMALLSLNIRLLIFSFAAIRLALYNTGSREKMVEFIGKYYIIGTCIASIYAFFYEFGKYNPDNRFGGLLYEGTYGTYIFYSYNLLISICFLTLCLIKPLSNKLSKKSLNIFIWIFLMICIFMNGTRKLLVAPFIFGVIVLIILYNKRPLRLIKWIGGSIILVITVYFVITTNHILYDAIGERITSFLLYLQTGDRAADASAYTRDQMKSLAWNLFIKYPISGIGANAFQEVYGDIYGVYLYSHNNYLEILCNQGIIGFIIYYGWYLYALLVTFKKAIRKNLYALGMFAFLITELILDFATISYMREHFILIYNMIAVYCMSDKANKNLRKEEKINENIKLLS